MKKLSFLLVLGGVIVAALSCHERARIASEDAFIGPRAASQLQQTAEPIPNPALAKVPAEQENLPKHEPGEDDNFEPIAGLSSQELDRRIIKEATVQAMDSKKYRILVREEPRGAKIFRELGMFIIVGPMGDTVYLPDEI